MARNAASTAAPAPPTQGEPGDSGDAASRSAAAAGAVWQPPPDGASPGTGAPPHVGASGAAAARLGSALARGYASTGDCLLDVLVHAKLPKCALREVRAVTSRPSPGALGSRKEASAWAAALAPACNTSVASAAAARAQARRSDAGNRTAGRTGALGDVISGGGGV